MMKNTSLTPCAFRHRARISSPRISSPVSSAMGFHPMIRCERGEAVSRPPPAMAPRLRHRGALRDDGGARRQVQKTHLVASFTNAIC